MMPKILRKIQCFEYVYVKISEIISQCQYGMENIVKSAIMTVFVATDYTN